MCVRIAVLFQLLFASLITRCHKFNIKHSWQNGVNVTVLYPHNESGNYEDNWITQVSYNMSYEAVGWDFLEVKTNPEFKDSAQAYAAGFGEGLINKPIYAAWYNTIRPICIEDHQKCDKINTFLDENIIWAKQMIKDYAATNPIWHQVALFYRQLEGIYDGYSYSNKEHVKNLTMRDILWINFSWDFEELAEALEPKNKTKIPIQARGLTHCSAIIKLLSNNSDILIAHNTWTSYTTMLRVIKTYILPYRLTEKSHHRIPGQIITFTSYPGAILSGDDYYIINSGLVALETTNGNSNVSLWEKVKPIGQMFTSVRVMVSNRLASDGLTWTKTFSYANSGTYNNQWMIINYNHFKPGFQPREGTLYILEQIPGYIRSGDETQILIDKGYWASYNIPFYTDIFKMSGNEELVQKYGDWFTYDKTPRAKIFKREHRRVKDTSSLMELMRYNDYKNDPFSRCNCTPPYSAENAIAARNDLNPVNGSYPFPALSHRSHGATDAKVTSFKLASNQQFYAICGPTTGKSLPNFQWSKTDFNDLPHLIQPDLFNFTYVLHKWKL